jgi:hypothetical protein
LARLSRSQWIGDGDLVPPFFRALAAQWQATRAEDASSSDCSDGSGGSGGSGGGGGSSGGGWVALHAHRPLHVCASAWEGLYEYVSCKLVLLLGAPTVLDFIRALCDPDRFETARPAAELEA